jgi:hypothetical protein
VFTVAYDPVPEFVGLYVILSDGDDDDFVVGVVATVKRHLIDSKTEFHVSVLGSNDETRKETRKLNRTQVEAGIRAASSGDDVGKRVAQFFPLHPSDRPAFGTVVAQSTVGAVALWKVKFQCYSVHSEDSPGSCVCQCFECYAGSLRRPRLHRS